MSSGLAPPLPSQPAPAQATTAGLTYVNPFASAQGPIARQTVPTISAALPTAPTVLSEKPFSSYQTPSPVSPYLNLYRSTNLAGVNDYYTLVRPMLEQQSYNQQIQRQLQSLQKATQSQSQSLYQLDQRTDYLYGLPSGGAHMNFQSWYPGFQPAGSR